MTKPVGHQLYHELQMLIAGRRRDEVINALVNALSSAVIQSATSPEAAAEFVADLTGLLQQDVVANWDAVRAHLVHVAEQPGRAQ